MRILDTVIYTEKLGDVRAFYEKHFLFPTATLSASTFGILPFAEGKITFVEAASIGEMPSQGVLLRLGTAFVQLERARLVAAGVQCGELTVEDWGAFYGQAVRYFTLTDPSGTRIQFFEDHYGEARQIITIGDGTGTRNVQR